MKRVEMNEYDAVVYYLIQAVRFERMATEAKERHALEEASEFAAVGRTFRKKADDLLGDHFHIRPYHMSQSAGCEYMAGRGWVALANHIADVFVQTQKQVGRSSDEACFRLITCGVHEPQARVQ
jgi:hypothetical protein